jgi:hypothetical protein
MAQLQVLDSSIWQKRKPNHFLFLFSERSFMRNRSNDISRKAGFFLLSVLFLSGCTGVDDVGGNPIGLFTPVEPSSNFGLMDPSSTIANGLLGDIFNPIRAVLISVAVLSVFVAGIALIAAPSQRSVDTAKTWLKYVLVGLIMLAAVNPFVNWLRAL